MLEPRRSFARCKRETLQLCRTPPPHAPPHSPTPGGGDLGHPGGASALEEGLHLGLSWELGRWPVGHLRSPSTTRTGATKPRSPAPLCPPRPGPFRRAPLQARLTALCAARVASGPRTLSLGAASPACPAAHFSPYPQLSSKALSLSLSFDSFFRVNYVSH